MIAISPGARAQDPSQLHEGRSVEPECIPRRANWDNEGDGGVEVA